MNTNDADKVNKIWSIVKTIITIIISAITGGVVEANASVISNLTNVL